MGFVFSNKIKVENTLKPRAQRENNLSKIPWTQIHLLERFVGKRLRKSETGEKLSLGKH